MIKLLSTDQDETYGALQADLVIKAACDELVSRPSPAAPTTASDTQ